jgi:octaprenyl-diphosphate synthase
MSDSTQQNAKNIDFATISKIVQREFQDVDKLIYEELGSNVPFIHEVGHYITKSGGKRLRPLVTLLSALACGYEGKQHIKVAAITELLHTATLLHDDVVDESDLRRGKATVNSRWNNAAAILVGDFLVSRSFQMIVGVGNIDLMKILADAANFITEGEVLQMVNAKNPNTTEESYLEVIRYKTGKMFEVAAQAGPVLAKSSKDIEQAMVQYAHHLGGAFQLIDDYLDYSSDAQTLGKNVGDDLSEGKPTLPLIYAIKHGSQTQSNLLKDSIRNGSLDKLDDILEIIQSTGAMTYTKDMAISESEKAKKQCEILEDSDYKKALQALSSFAIERSF